MTAENFYILSALPGLVDMAVAPSIRPRQLLEMTESNPPAQEAVACIFLSDDLIARQSFLSGEITEVDPIVLSDAQMRNEAPLPSYLVHRDDDITFRIPDDVLWDNFFHHTEGIAAKTGNVFLKDWVGFEVSLRNQLAVARAKALNLESQNYLVATQLQDGRHDFSHILSEWSAAATPLAGQNVLDQGRWNWLGEHDQWFSFSNEELAAYAAKLILVNRQQRLRQTPAGDGKRTS